jgi:aminomuconate-semialdehyde/2-hydroxymuconate-6-semialdehyde dehydrogenase
MLSSLVNEAGFPKGVLNVLHGRGARIGAAISAHPSISAISFTGGTATGTKIYSEAAKQLKKVSLELGGKNPVIVFEDADFDAAVQGAKMAAFANQGQVCLCGERLFVQESIYEKFRDAFVQKAQQIKIGDPLETGTEHGATVSKEHMEKVLSYVALARQEGGTVLCGGQRRMVEGRCKDGYFIEPTVIEGLPQSCRTNQEEIFGPVVTIMPFDTEDEVLEYANSVRYGLSATVWTENLSRAHRVASKLESGIVWINCWLLRDLRTPFGGVKDSGMGREGGFEALRFFTEEKNVCIRFDPH